MFAATLLLPGYTTIPTNKMPALAATTYIHEDKNAAINTAFSYARQSGYQTGQCRVLVSEISGEAKAPEVEYVVEPLSKELK